ncbi:helix-turn-helix domain-containing protein [Rhizobium grahamii]|uniref:helix-turn-helix domain-containing protein n=1 Tax=Rhizobium grahamii TaxID=1120045 RepID=UPI000E0A20BE
MLGSSQCRAARALLDWTQNELAARTSISAASIRAFEKGGGMRGSNLRRLRQAFEAAGVIFQGEGETAPGGAGDRFQSSRDRNE